MNILSEEDALVLARKEILVLAEKSLVDLEIIKGLTREFKYGWVFFYDSEMYLKTGEFQYMIGGNAPLIVDKYNGSVHYTGTGESIDFYINQYCENRIG